MKKMSIRHYAGIEVPSGGGSVGISTAVRKYWRKHFAGVPNMQMPNDKLNYIIALDYTKAQLVFRFILKSGEPAEIRKSNSFYYISALRKTGRHDIIVIQPAIKEAPEEVKKRRLTKEWLEDVFSGKIKRRK